MEIVFFDAGDTILHAHPSFPELFSGVCRRHGVELPAERVARVQERLAPHLIDLAEESGVKYSSLSADASQEFWSWFYRRLLAELDITADALVADLYRTFSDSASYRLFDDALPTLRRLREAGYRLGLVSNFEEWLEEMLVELEVGDVFDVAVISGIEGVEKPDAAIYRLALERASVDASEAVHVGDSPGLDVEPAQAVGLAAVLLDRKGRYPRAGAPRITSLTELPDLVDGM